jgi:hypothetical protein
MYIHISRVHFDIITIKPIIRFATWSVYICFLVHVKISAYVVQYN